MKELFVFLVMTSLISYLPDLKAGYFEESNLTRDGFNGVNFMGSDGVDIFGFHSGEIPFIYNIASGDWSTTTAPEFTTGGARLWGGNQNYLVGMKNFNSEAFYIERGSGNLFDINFTSLNTAVRGIGGFASAVGSAGSHAFIADLSIGFDENNALLIDNPFSSTTKGWNLDETGLMMVAEVNNKGAILLDIYSDTMDPSNWLLVDRPDATRVVFQDIYNGIASGFFTESGSGNTIATAYDINNDIWYDVPFGTFAQGRGIHENKVYLSSKSAGAIYVIPEPWMLPFVAATFLVLGVMIRRRR